MARVAIACSGNIGSDLLIKVAQISCSLEVPGLAGIDPSSDGPAEAGGLP